MPRSIVPCGFERKLVLAWLRKGRDKESHRVRRRMVMKLGFGFCETMRGTFFMLEAPMAECPMSFTIAVRVAALRPFLQNKRAAIEGEVTMEGFADRRPLKGTLGFHMHDEKRLPYDFVFQADDGKPYHFRGQKDLNLLTIHDSFTLLPASLYDEAGCEVGRATLRFDLRRDFKKFVGSFRVHTGL
jgi:hypothetical protein